AVLLAQPITRAEVYVGKYVGLLGAVATSIFTGFGLAGLVVGALAGGGNALVFLQLVGLTVLLAAVTLAVGTLLSAPPGSTANAVGGAFAAWLALVYGSDLGAIGLAAARSLTPGQVFTLALLNPVEQARVLGTLALTSRPEVLGVVGIFGQDLLGTNGLSLLLAAALIISAAGALGGGWALFRKAGVPWSSGDAFGRRRHLSSPFPFPLSCLQEARQSARRRSVSAATLATAVTCFSPAEDSRASAGARMGRCTDTTTSVACCSPWGRRTRRRRRRGWRITRAPASSR